MTRAWFLQANPKHYDIDAAVVALDRIWWRVPQYTGEIHAGDVAVLWRSGSEAGIVGVGRVLTEPQVRSVDPADRRFMLSSDEDADASTRILIQLRPTRLMRKDEVRGLPELDAHQIVRAPMGTVFPISDEAWRSLGPHLADPPSMIEEPGSAFPPGFAWPQRSKGVLPMPGGYGGYLQSLGQVCALVETGRPSSSELVSQLQEAFNLKATAARMRESFLRKVGILENQGGVLRLSRWSKQWRESGDDRIIVALLHSRCQLIGELLEAALEPRSNEELLRIANERYGMGWDTQTQIVNRRGWLQSGGMIAITDEGNQTTPAGREMLGLLSLHDPAAPANTDAAAELIVDLPVELAPTPSTGSVVALIETLTDSATDSKNPDRFEHAVRAAFEFLGFQAEWLGGSGRTDVLLDAVLGKDDTYRVTVDCKTSASGSVGDQQVDWVTLSEHRVKHDAQHTAVVAPNPSGSRLLDRARDQHVTIISVDQLAGLCRQHAKTPLGLDDYHSLFEHVGALDTQLVDERAEEVTRVATLAAATCNAIRDRSNAFGRISARDLFLILSGTPLADATSEAELAALLDTLASPLLQALEGSADRGYRVTTSAAVSRRRLEAIARQLGDAPSAG